MNKRVVHIRSDVTTRASRAAMWWLVLSALGCAPKAQNDADDPRYEADASVDVEDHSGVSEKASGTGTVRNLRFVKYVYLPRTRQRTTVSNVTANYIVYDESNGREGHNDIHPSQPGFVGISGAKLVAYGGGRDKYIALFKVERSTVTIDLDQGQEDSDGGAGHALFIQTDRVLKSTGSSSIESPRLVPDPSADEVVIYAEDEGGKGDRDRRFGAVASLSFGSGDDLVYVFARSLRGTPNGDGAFMKLKIQ